MRKINFVPPLIQNPSNVGIDFSSNDYSSNKDFLNDIIEACNASTLGQIISIGLWNSIGSRSIPLIYRDLISLWYKYADKEFALKVFVASDEVLDHLYRYMPWDFRPKKHIDLKPGFQLIITVGDIVPEPWVIVEEKEAIINASNESLILGGGVSNSIQQMARPTLQQELLMIAKNKIEIGQAVVTDAHGIPGVSFIVHVPTATGTEAAVYKGTWAALKAGEERQEKKLVFPALGTGTGNLPIQKCSELMLRAIHEFAAETNTPTQMYIIKLWRKSDFEKFGPK